MKKILILITVMALFATACGAPTPKEQVFIGQALAIAKTVSTPPNHGYSPRDGSPLLFSPDIKVNIDGYSRTTGEPLFVVSRSYSSGNGYFWAKVFPVFFLEESGISYLEIQSSRNGVPWLLTLSDLKNSPDKLFWD